MARYDLVCPVYALMPDHIHLVWMGVSEQADQKKAAKFFREHVNELLDRSFSGARFQQQVYDHVLRQHERGADAVRQVAEYVLQNPVRANLVKVAEGWPYAGCMVPGYPALHPLEDGYWERFWKIRSKMLRDGAECSE